MQAQQQAHRGATQTIAQSPKSKRLPHGDALQKKLNQILVFWPRNANCLTLFLSGSRRFIFPLSGEADLTLK